ncbi:MAG: hypothetical protein H3C35_08485 [Bacteroidetes bacterium]|nr:hypothetical protein [Bacteroidota bacterium]
MKQSKIANTVGVSRSTVNQVLKGKYNHKTEGSIVERIFLLSNFETEFLPEVFSNNLFLEMCETAVEKSRKREVREFAAVLKQAALSLRKKTDNKNGKEE